MKDQLTLLAENARQNLVDEEVLMSGSCDGTAGRMLANQQLVKDDVDLDLFGKTKQIAVAWAIIDLGKY